MKVKWGCVGTMLCCLLFWLFVIWAAAGMVQW